MSDAEITILPHASNYHGIKHKKDPHEWLGKDAQLSP